MLDYGTKYFFKKGTPEVFLICPVVHNFNFCKFLTFALLDTQGLKITQEKTAAFALTSADG